MPSDLHFLKPELITVVEETVTPLNDQDLFLTRLLSTQLPAVH